MKTSKGREPGLRRVVGARRSVIVCEDCGKRRVSHRCRPVDPNDQSGCSRSLCDDCGADEHGK